MKTIIPGEGSRPAICTPLVGKTDSDIFAELSHILPQKPDMLEWRADFFQDINNTGSVVHVAKAIKEAAGNIPLIFTIRSASEGGQSIPLSAQEKISLNAKIANDTAVEYIDYELSNEPEHIEFLRQAAHANSKKIIASFHQFEYTPSKEVLCQKIIQTKEYGLDIAKIAVMPRDMQDVLELLSAVLTAGEKARIPIIAVAMGRYGLITRLAGGMFGSVVTFAVGHSASAPGQVGIEDLRLVLDVIEKNMKDNS